MPVQNTETCGICKSEIERAQISLQCTKCSSLFHFSCSGLRNKALAAYFNCVSCAGVAVDEAATRADFSKLSEKLDNYFKKNEQDYAELKKSIDVAISDLNTKLSTGLENLNNEVMDCRDFVKDVDMAALNRSSAMEAEINILHRRLNRADVVISGLPTALSDLKYTILSVCRFYNLEVPISSLNQVCYIGGRRLVLVKFNDVAVRDKLMSEYFKTKNLKLCDVIGGEIQSRVYPNDHMTPSAGKLNSICRKLLQRKVVSKYKILNADRLVAKLTMVDGSEVMYNIEKCAALLDGAAAETS